MSAARYIVLALVSVVAVACSTGTAPVAPTAAVPDARDVEDRATDEPTASPAPGPIESAARKSLAEETGADEQAFTLVSSEEVQWSDASLGCPREGYLYTQVITPGHKLVFDLRGVLHEAHTNADGSNVVLCGTGR